MEENNVLLEDGAVTLALAGQQHTIKALPIRKSIAWTKVVMADLTSEAETARELSEAKTPEERLAVIQKGGKQTTIERVLGWLTAHSGIPAEALEDASAREVMDAFGALWPVENPTSDLPTILAQRKR